MVKSVSKTSINVPEKIEKVESSTNEIPTKSKLRETASGNNFIEKFARKAKNQEAKRYDFIEARGTKRRTASVPESIAFILRFSLGGGLLTIHYAVLQCGAWTAMALNCGLGFILSYCMYLLASSAQKLYGRTHVPSMMYPDLAEAALLIGPWPSLRKHSMTFRYIVVVMEVVTLFGCCYIYQVLMARTIKQLIDESPDINDDIPPTLRTYVIVIVIPIMSVCMMVTSLSYLAPFSMVAGTVFILITVSSFYYGLKSANRTIGDMTAFKTRDGLVGYIGTFTFTVEGTVTTLAIEGNMTNPKKIGFVISVGMFIVILMTAIVGFFGFWGFVEKCTAPITVNFPWTPFPIMLKAFTAVTLLLTYALNYWLLFNLLWYYIKPQIHPDRCKIWENVYRALLVLIITSVAALQPNVQHVVTFIGCSLLIWLGIIFPAFIDILAVWEDPGLGKLKWRLVTDVSMLIGGIIVSIFGSAFSAISFIRFVFSEQPPINNNY